jgi:hypothetical protein
MLTLGIDLHKRDLVIATVDAEGAEIEHKRVRAREAEVLRYFSVRLHDGTYQHAGNTSCYSGKNCWYPKEPGSSGEHSLPTGVQLCLARVQTMRGTI